MTWWHVALIAAASFGAGYFIGLTIADPLEQRSYEAPYMRRKS